MIGIINLMKIILKAIIKKDDKFLVLLRSEKARYFPLHWDFPGGTLEENEDPEDGIIREVLEETGLKIGIIAKLKTYEFDLDNAKKITHRFVIYKAEVISGKFKISEEHLAYKWLTKDELLRLPIEAYMRSYLAAESSQ